MKRCLLVVLLLILGALPAAAQRWGSNPATPTPSSVAETPQLLLGDVGFEISDADLELIALLAELEQSRTEDGGFLLGDPDAPLTIVEFSDWACPHCQDYRETIDTIIREYVPTGAVNFELRIFPTAGRENTVFFGQVAECAEQQVAGAFWTWYVLLYGTAENNLYTSNQQVRTLLSATGIDLNTAIACLEAMSESGESQVATDMALGNESGVSGTPAVLIRQNGGPAVFIVLDGVTYNRGGVPLNVLEALISGAAAGEPV
jgi:protein-disulfide isomerase